MRFRILSMSLIGNGIVKNPNGAIFVSSKPGES
jgi:hypothetical protein